EPLQSRTLRAHSRPPGICAPSIHLAHAPSIIPLTFVYLMHDHTRAIDRCTLSTYLNLY
ncbi:hypothetical protein K443DRAFT_664069, partial [Laccaria amethystina LaAM-08-1]